jgi:hypothetical protein
MRGISMDKATFALEDFKNIQELIRFIDQKAGAVLVIYGFLITAFIEFAKNLIFINPFSLSTSKAITFSIITFLSGAILILILIYQIYYILFKIIEPKVASNYCKGEQCLYYFEHISNMKKSKFMDDIMQLSEDEMLQELSGQVFEVSKIMSKKREDFCKVIRFLYVSIIILLVFILSSKLI